MQCRRSGQTLFLRSTGSREWEWSLPGAGEVQVQLQLQSCPHTCTVPGVGRSVLRTEREREREADVDVDPCTCSSCNATDRDWESLLLAHPNQALGCTVLTARTRWHASSLHSALWTPGMTLKLRDGGALGKRRNRTDSHSPEVTMPPSCFSN